jgi:hypothetical protein
MENHCKIEPHIFFKNLRDRISAKSKWRNLSKQINQNETKSIGEPCVFSSHLGLVKYGTEICFNVFVVMLLG